MLRVDLPASVTEQLHAALKTMPAPSPPMELPLAGLLRLSNQLPTEILATILSFRAAVDVPGTLLITGMPIDHDLPPTPTDDTGEAFEAGHISYGAILMIAVLLGEPVAYRDEKNGRLVQDVFPVPEFRSSPSNEGSATELTYHSELTFSRESPELPLHTTCPDFVLLLGLRCPAERAPATTTVEARDLCRRLSECQLDVLRDAQFQLRAPHSFTRDGGTRPWSEPVGLLRGSTDAPSLAFDAACGVRSLSEDAAAALDALRVACNDVTIQSSVKLRAGDLLVIDNNRCVHSRSPFAASFDGRDRWLRRAYVRRSIWELKFASTASRVVS